MVWLLFLATALVIVIAGVRLARFGDVLGEKTGMGRNWAGLALLAATTSLPELFTGIGSTAVAALPNIAVGDILGSCMFNLLILSFMDALQPEPLSTRAHQGHTLSIAFGLLLLAVAGLALAAGVHVPMWQSVSLVSPVLIVLYFVAVRVIFRHEQHRRSLEVQEVAEELHYSAISLRSAVIHYAVAAAFVVAAALWLPALGAELARQSGLGQDVVGSFFIAITTSLPEVVVSIACVRIGAIDLGIGNILGSNLFNMLILGIDDLFYRQGALLASVNGGHSLTVVAVVIMYALFLIGLTYRVLTKRFVVSWDTGAIGIVYALTATLAYLGAW